MPVRCSDEQRRVDLRCYACQGAFSRMLDGYEEWSLENRSETCGPFCDACTARHEGRRCARCWRSGCAHYIAQCGLCHRQVCFFDRSHSVRAAGETCCLECVLGREIKPRVVALLDHLPAGVVRGVAGVIERLAPSEPYGSALARTAAQWVKCSVCRVRGPELRKDNGTCDTCGRMSRWIRARCAACGPWRCRCCRAAYNA